MREGDVILKTTFYSPAPSFLFYVILLYFLWGYFCLQLLLLLTSKLVSVVIYIIMLRA